MEPGRERPGNQVERGQGTRWRDAGEPVGEKPGNQVGETCPHSCAHRTCAVVLSGVVVRWNAVLRALSVHVHHGVVYDLHQLKCAKH